jgi:hypothetical protein
VASRLAILLSLLLANSAFLEAQEVKVVDLLNVSQRAALRFPAASHAVRAMVFSDLDHVGSFW